MAEMTIEMAKEIINQGQKHGAWDGELPTNDDDFRKGAAQLVQLARNAWDGGIKSDAVYEILFACQVEPPADDPGKYNEVYERKQATPPVPSAAAPAAAAQAPSPEQPTPAAAPPPTPDGSPTPPSAELPTDFDINSIVPGYDDRKVKELKEAIIAAAASGDLTPEELALIKAYESENEERKGILSLEPEFKKPDPPAAAASGNAFAQPGDSDLESAYSSGALGNQRAAQEGLSIPPNPTGELDPLPIDITSKSPEEISRLAMQYHSHLARALFIQSQEEGRRDVAKQLGDDAWNDAFTREFSRLKSEAKDTAAAIDAARSEAKHLADVDQSVKTWRHREANHGAEARTIRALAESYSQANERLSREQSRREKLSASSTG
jgi:hypothetical protein